MNKESIILFDRVPENTTDNFGLDNPTVTMAKRLTTLFYNDLDIIKVELDGDTANVYIINYVKACALASIFKSETEYLKIRFIYICNGKRFEMDGSLPEITEGTYDSGWVNAAFYGNPVIHDVREIEDEMHVKKWFVICNRKYLCQFAVSNNADYKGNYTELPADVLSMFTKSNFAFQWCTEA